MSIIISLIYNGTSFVFSDGRITTENEKIRDDYNKTLCLFDNKLLIAFCGLIYLDTTDKNKNTNIREIIETEYPKFTFDQVDLFIKQILDKIKFNYKLSKPKSTIDIHFTINLSESDKKFHFKQYNFNKKGETINIVENENKITSDFFRVDGDDNVCISFYEELKWNLDRSSTEIIIIQVKELISSAPKIAKVNLSGISNCGGKIYYEIINHN